MARRITRGSRHKKGLESIEEGFQIHEDESSEIDDALREPERQPALVNETEQDISEGKPFGEVVI